MSLGMDRDFIYHELNQSTSQPKEAALASQKRHAQPKTKRSPGRPKKNDAENTPGVRDRILAAAEEIIAERGFQALTWEEVCERSRANSAMVAYYFGNKSGLCEAVVRSHIESYGVFVDWLKQQLDGKQLDLEGFGGLISRVFDWNRKNERIFRFNMAALMQKDDLYYEMAARAWLPNITTCTRALSKLAGGTPSKASDANAVIMLCMFQVHATIQFFVGGFVDPKVRDQALERFESLLKNTILPELIRHSS
jgi:AcrR family transcriptional regulator